MLPNDVPLNSASAPKMRKIMSESTNWKSALASMLRHPVRRAPMGVRCVAWFRLSGINGEILTVKKVCVDVT